MWQAVATRKLFMQSRKAVRKLLVKAEKTGEEIVIRG